jgi:hypothetical protein
VATATPEGASSLSCRVFLTQFTPEVMPLDEVSISDRLLFVVRFTKNYVK